MNWYKTEQSLYVILTLNNFCIQTASFSPHGETYSQKESMILDKFQV